MIFGSLWGLAFALGLVLALNSIAPAHHQVSNVASFLIGLGCGGLGNLIGSGSAR